MRFEKQAATGAGSSMSKTDEPSQPLFFDMAIPDAKNKSAMKVVRALAVAAQYDRTVDNVIPLEEDVTPPTPISAGPGEQQPPSDPTDGQANVAPQSGQPTPFNTTGGEENPEKGQPQNSNATSNVAKTTSFSSLETTDEEELTIDKIVLRPRQHKLSVQSGECKCHESSQGLSTGGLAAAVMKDTDSLFVSACELCAKSIGESDSDLRSSKLEGGLESDSVWDRCQLTFSWLDAESGTHNSDASKDTDGRRKKGAAAIALHFLQSLTTKSSEAAREKTTSQKPEPAIALSNDGMLFAEVKKNPNRIEIKLCRDPFPFQTIPLDSDQAAQKTDPIPRNVAFPRLLCPLRVRCPVLTAWLSVSQMESRARCLILRSSQNFPPQSLDSPMQVRSSRSTSATTA